jgi:hypothetical protein
MIKYLNSKIIKPDLKAFPLTWMWIVFYSYILFAVDSGSGGIFIAIYILLPLILIMLFATYGRSYQLRSGIITKTNLIAGTKESVYISAIRNVQVKPIAFGYGHIILTLFGGHEFKIKNIKLSKVTRLLKIEKI